MLKNYSLLSIIKSLCFCENSKNTTGYNVTEAFEGMSVDCCMV